MKKLRRSKRQKQALFLSVVTGSTAVVLYRIWVWVSSHIIETIVLLLIVAIISGRLIWRKNPSIRKIVSKIINRFTPVKDNEVQELIKVIEGIRVQNVRDEEDFEKQLFQRLDAKNYKVERQVHYGSNKIVDLVVDERIGIELKVADRAKNVRDLIGQVTVYKKHLKKIIVGILDSGDVSDLDEYMGLIKKVDRRNIHVLAIKGDVNRPKKSGEYIMVKKVPG